MNTSIFLGYIPVPGWQHKIDFVTKAVLGKKILIFRYENKQKNPPSKDATWGFRSKKVAILGGGGVCCKMTKIFGFEI